MCLRASAVLKLLSVINELVRYCVENISKYNELSSMKTSNSKIDRGMRVSRYLVAMQWVPLQVRYYKDPSKVVWYCVEDLQKHKELLNLRIPYLLKVRGV